MDEGDITDLVNQLIQEAAQNNQYNPSMVPNHIGNGLDAPKPNFIGLGDTPHNYSGFAGYFTRVNSTETAIEFYSPTIPSVTDIQIFNTSGTWTKPAGAKSVLIEGWGAGGGSGGCTSNSASPGGGGGGYIYRQIPASSLGTTETVTCGANGTAGGTGVTTGGNGGDSTFGTWLTAGGGKGGKVRGDTTTGGDGGGVGSATSPYSVFAGRASTVGTANPADWGGGGGGGLNVGTAAAGGNSIWGSGGGGAGSTGTGAAGGTSTYDGGTGGTGGNGGLGQLANQGGFPGGGAGGAGSNAVGDKAGAAGGAGKIRVTTFF